MPKQEMKDPTLVISTASRSSVNNLLFKIKLRILVSNDIIQMESLPSFEPFQWNDSQTESTQTAAAMAHCQTQLSSFGITFGNDRFQLYDVHKEQGYLTLEDEKLGKLTGGVDCIIAPAGLAISSVRYVACVAIELKTKKNVEERNGIDNFQAQGTLELLATNYYSDQLSLVVVTDLYSGAMAWTLKRVDGIMTIVTYGPLSLQQMASLIAQHINNNCIPNPVFSLKRALEDPILSQKEAIQIQSMFKKARVSTDDLALEHFYELLEETSDGTQERAQVVREFLWSQGLSSSYLSMYC
jgi:hypothetical protein